MWLVTCCLSRAELLPAVAVREAAEGGAPGGDARYPVPHAPRHPPGQSGGGNTSQIIRKITTHII